jgi:GTP-binding protein
LRISAEFVTSAVGAAGVPGGGLPEIALVGRSNVGKSSLINALAHRRLARTSGKPGKTRLVNVYRVARGPIGPLYLVDLPGYGHAAGDTEELARVAAGYFGRPGQAGERMEASPPGVPGLPGRVVSALLLVDARHPGLPSDRSAWNWLGEMVGRAALVATKIDKLARGQRIRAMRELESAFEHPALPVSAVTGEGLDELWKLIDRLANSHNPPPRHSSPSSRPPRATAPPPPKK